MPHFNFYRPVATGDVYPRLTDKRSCVYYLGRLICYCLTVSGKMPNYFCDNFWKCLTGGRYFIDEELDKKYYNVEDRSFRTNSTLPQTELQFKLTDE